VFGAVDRYARWKVIELRENVTVSSGVTYRALGG